ncbi:MAG: hypothetical protein AABY22_09325 [Nanoarchaeota archaeon]
MDHNISIDEEWAIFYRVEWKVDLIHKFCNNKNHLPHASLYFDTDIPPKCYDCGTKVPEKIVAITRLYCSKIKI